MAQVYKSDISLTFTGAKAKNRKSTILGQIWDVWQSN